MTISQSYHVTISCYWRRHHAHLLSQDGLGYSTQEKTKECQYLYPMQVVGYTLLQSNDLSINELKITLEKIVCVGKTTDVEFWYIWQFCLIRVQEIMIVYVDFRTYGKIDVPQNEHTTPLNIGKHQYCPRSAVTQLELTSAYSKFNLFMLWKCNQRMV